MAVWEADLRGLVEELVGECHPLLRSHMPSHRKPK